MPKIKFALKLEKVLEDQESDSTPSTMPSVHLQIPELIREDSSIKKYHRRAQSGYDCD